MTANASQPAHQSTNLTKYTVDSRIYQWHIEQFLVCFSEMLASTAPQTVLDAGCGEGFSVGYLARKHPGVAFTGVDLSEGAVAYAQAHFGDRVRFEVGSVFALPFDDDAFDTVVCSEVLEHLDTPERAVAELKRVARRHVLITVPREPYFQWLNDLGQALGVSDDPGHVNFWTKQGFQDFIRAHFGEARFAWKHIYQLAVATV